MSWIAKNSLTWLQSIAIKVLKAGHVPKHVAFIMDGNRRYAKKTGVEKIEGHKQGFNKLAEVLQWCLEFGVREVTVYAFSLENFKRTDEEVRNLMDLAKEKFQRLLDEKDKLMEHGVCVRIIGNLSYVPPDVRKLMIEAMQITKDNNRAILNVAFAYTSRDEITNAVKDVVRGVKSGEITVDDVDEDLMSKCLYTHSSEDLDLLIRTSGEVRFSDFLMWQSTYTCLYFTKVLWPEFSAWDLIYAVFYYQRCYSDLTRVKSDIMHAKNQKKDSEMDERTSKFVNRLHKERELQLDDDITATMIK